MTLNWDLVDSLGATHGKLTGFAAASNNNAMIQDGFTTGTLLGLSVDQKGIINGLFNNGQSEKLNRIAIGRFSISIGVDPLGK